MGRVELLGVSVNRSSHLPPTQLSGPGSPLGQALGETLPPWRPTELARRQATQSTLVGPSSLTSSWGGTGQWNAFLSLSFLDYTLISLLVTNVKHLNYYPLIHPL